LRCYAVKLNRKLTGGPCAICSKAVDADIGPELFLVDNWELVCRRCGREEAPELVALLELAEASKAYFTAIFESEDRFTPEDLG